jgi:hypothetical protein
MCQQHRQLQQSRLMQQEQQPLPQRQQRSRADGTQQ